MDASWNYSAGLLNLLVQTWLLISVSTLALGAGGSSLNQIQSSENIVILETNVCTSSVFCVRGVASARPRRASKRLDCTLSKHGASFIKRKGKDCHDQDKQVQGASFGSFLAPEIHMIFGDGVGGSLVRSSTTETASTQRSPPSDDVGA